MNQVKNVLSSLFEPLTKIETYENLAIKIALIIIYIIVALIVIAILNKVIEQAFKIQNRSSKGNKKRSRTLISLVQNVVSYIVWFIVITTILSKFGISVEGIIASAGVVGLALVSVLKRLLKISSLVSLLYLKINLTLAIMLKSIAVVQQ